MNVARTRSARAIFVAIAFFWMNAALAQAQRNVIVAVPQLGGDHELAIPVTNFLRLKLSTFFRTAGTETRGRMIWLQEELDPPTHSEAERMGLTLNAPHLVLWGSSYRFPDGIAVQPFLSTTSRIWAPVRGEPPPNMWVVDPSGENRAFSGTGPKFLTLNIPRSFYRLSPLLVDNSSVSDFPTLDSLPIFETSQMANIVGQTGTLFTALEYRTDKVRLTSNGTSGWVSLNKINARQSTAVNFASSVFRILRGDFDGAAQLLNSLSEQDGIGSQLKVDLALLRGFVQELRGGNGRNFFEQAYRLAPLDQTSARFLLLSLLETMLYDENEEVVEEARSRLFELIEETRPLFSDTSNWFSILSSAARRN